MGYIPQESLDNTINTMGALLGVHPIVPWYSSNKKTPRMLAPEEREGIATATSW